MAFGSCLLDYISGEKEQTLNLCGNAVCRWLEECSFWFEGFCSFVNLQ